MLSSDMDVLNFLLFFTFLLGSRAAVIPNKEAMTAENVQELSPPGKSELPNQAGNAEMSNPAPNTEISNKAQNAEMSNKAPNAEIANPAPNTEMSNKVSDTEMSNPAPKVEMSNKAPNAEMSNKAPNAEMSNKAPNAEMSNPAPNVEMSNKAPNAEISNKALNAEMSNKAPNAEMSNPAPNAEMSNKEPNAEMSNKMSDTEMSNKAPNAEMSNKAPNAEIANQAGNTETSNPTSNTEVSNPESKTEKSNLALNKEKSNSTTKIKMSNPATNVEMSNSAPKVEMSNPAPKVEMSNPAPNMENLDQAPNTGMSNQATNTEISNIAGNVEMPNTGGKVEMSNPVENPQGSSQSANSETDVVSKTLPSTSRTQKDIVEAATESKPMINEPNVSNMKLKASSDSTQPKTGNAGKDTPSTVSTESVSASGVINKPHNSPSQKAANLPSNNLDTEQLNDKPSGVNNAASDIIQTKTEGESTVVKKEKTTKKVASANPATKRSKASKEQRILARLSKANITLLKKLILSKTAKSKTIRRLALQTFVKKAKDDGMTSESIIGETRLDQFQIDKFMKLNTESVRKLIFGTTKFSERMRKNALNVYLKLNLPSKVKVDKDTNKPPIPSGVKKGDNVAPWSQANEDSEFPVQTHAKPFHPNLSQPESAVVNTEVIPKNVNSEKDKTQNKAPIPSGVKTGDNVQPWSQANEDSEFPVQTHAKPFHPNLSKPESAVVNTEVIPKNVNSEKDKTQNKALIPSGVKTGDNVQPWSQANEDSEFPVQTHAKPFHPNLSKPESAVVNTEVIPSKVKSEKDKNRNKAPIPSGVKKGDNVAPWSQANEDSEFPVQTHAKPFHPNLNSDQPASHASKTADKKDNEMSASSIQPSQSETTAQDGHTSKTNMNLSQLPEIDIKTSVGSQTGHVSASDPTVNSVQKEQISATKTASKSTSIKAAKSASPKGANDKETPVMNAEPQLQTAAVETPPKLDLDKPFSAPMNEQVLPVKHTSAKSPHDTPQPFESSSFVKTSQILSTGDHVNRGGEPPAVLSLIRTFRQLFRPFSSNENYLLSYRNFINVFFFIFPEINKL